MTNRHKAFRVIARSQCLPDRGVVHPLGQLLLEEHSGRIVDHGVDREALKGLGEQHAAAGPALLEHGQPFVLPGVRERHRVARPRRSGGAVP